jgi:PTH1 family peptidyl-tRNA hydrolase
LKYLIFGLGNIGPEYKNTRHNIGFTILDALADASNIVFKPDRYAYVAEYKFKARNFVLIKPTTYMNLSGKAVNYWMQKTGVPMSSVLVLVDDLALPFGTLRLRAKGSDGGHNGLKSIIETTGRSDFPRLRFGIGDSFGKGQQVDYVLGEWEQSERKNLEEKVQVVHDLIRSFGTIGIQRTMNLYNTKPGDIQ